MQVIPVEELSKTLSPFPEANPVCVQHHTKPSLSTWICSQTRRHLKRLRRKQRIWVSLWGSLREHNRIQNAIGPELGTRGPLVQWDAQGNLCGNVRTLARIVCTEKLLTAYPKLDSADWEIFLMGFDAGEEWAGNQDCHITPCRSDDDDNTTATSAWLTLADIQRIKDESRSA